MKLILLLSFLLMVFLNLFLQFRTLKNEINFVFSVAVTILFASFYYFAILIVGCDITLPTILLMIISIVLLAIKVRQGAFKNITVQNIYKRVKKTDIVFLFLCLFAILLFINNTQKWGLWDAWAIWSLHAEFLANPESWRNIFDPALAWNHTDYPLMLPAFIAMFWNATGQISSLVPFIIGLIPYILLLIFMYHAFDNKMLGIIAVFILIIDIGFITRSASQYADTYLSLFIVLSYYGYTESRKENHIKLWSVLTGIVASGAMWIKNEGLAFFLIFAVLWGLTFIKDRKKILLFLAGSSLTLVIILIYKFLIAPANDVITINGNSYSNKLTDSDRYLFIYRYLRDYLLYAVPALLLLITAAIMSKSKTYLFPAISLILIFAAFFVVYVLSPYGLQWHLETSADRLVHQLTPAVLLLAIPAAVRFLKEYSGKESTKI